MEVVVHAEKLFRSFGTVRAVDGISFDVGRGEMFGLIGPDGAGKTTTLRMLLGLLRPDSGTAHTCGLAPKEQHAELSERIGYLPQRFSLYGDLSVDENISFFAEMHGVPDWHPRRTELLEMFRLQTYRERLADRLSGGMKQKLALACTLIHRPKLLVLDEATTGVDPVSRREFWKILSSLQREGMTILLTTPYLDEAERCNRVALLNRGRILNLDTPEGLLQLGAGAILEILASPRRTAAGILASHPDISDVQSFGERIHATVSPASHKDVTALARGVEQLLRDGGLNVQSVRVTSPRLEDVFISRIRSLETPKEENPI